MNSELQVLLDARIQTAEAEEKRARERAERSREAFAAARARDDVGAELAHHGLWGEYETAAGIHRRYLVFLRELRALL
jgi:hypothetical protein